MIRLRSIHSSRQAPSLDIGRAFGLLHAVRHLISGGYVVHDVDGTPIPRRQAGSAVLHLIDDPQFLHFMSMSALQERETIGTTFLKISVLRLT